MKSKRKEMNISQTISKNPEPEVLLRRTSRALKPKNDDEFLVGQEELDKYIGKDSPEEQYGAKRVYKNYWHEDCSDYQDHYSQGKKKYRIGLNVCRSPPINPVEGLLKWTSELDIETKIPTKDNSKLIKVKNICKEQLDKHVQGIEALFINIDWNKKGQTLADFKQLKIHSTKFMSKGLAFIWVPKSMVAEIIECMEQKGFDYVENLQIALLDRKKAQQIFRAKRLGRKAAFLPLQEEEKQLKKVKEEEQKLDQDIPLQDLIKGLDNISPNDLISETPSKYFNSSRKTMFIFRKKSSEKIELRHQRSCDVVFHMPKNVDAKCDKELKAYLFMMIQTMLPKCLQFEHNFKMLQLWGDVNSCRKGWVTMIDQ